MAANPLRDEFRMHRVPGSCAVVIFGGLGDLASRKLCRRSTTSTCAACCRPAFAMIGIGRTDPGGDEGYRAEMRKRCEEFSRTPVTDAEWDGFAELLNWITGTFDDADDLPAAADAPRRGRARARHRPATCSSTCRCRPASSRSSSTASATRGLGAPSTGGALPRGS